MCHDALRVARMYLYAGEVIAGAEKALLCYQQSHRELCKKVTPSLLDEPSRVEWRMYMDSYYAAHRDHFVHVNFWMQRQIESASLFARFPDKIQIQVILDLRIRMQSSTWTKAAHKQRAYAFQSFMQTCPSLTVSPGSESTRIHLPLCLVSTGTKRAKMNNGGKRRLSSDSDSYSLSICPCD